MPKCLFVVVGSILALLEPTIPFAAVLFFAIMLDCYSAYDLSRRLKKQGENVEGKFQSKYALKMFDTFIKTYLVVILLYAIDKVLLPIEGLNLANWGAALFCFLQIWSILENMSSANGAVWAGILQKIMVSKTERHLNIDLTDLKKDKDKENET